MNDLRYPLRMVRTNPGFQATAMLSPGAQPDAVTAFFTAVAVLLRPPFPDPDHLMMVSMQKPRAADRAGRHPLAVSQDWRRETRMLEHVAAVRREPVSPIDDSTPELA